MNFEITPLGNTIFSCCLHLLNRQGFRVYSRILWTEFSKPFEKKIEEKIWVELSISISRCRERIMFQGQNRFDGLGLGLPTIDEGPSIVGVTLWKFSIGAPIRKNGVFPSLVYVDSEFWPRFFNKNGRVDAKPLRGPRNLRHLLEKSPSIFFAHVPRGGKTILLFVQWQSSEKIFSFEDDVRGLERSWKINEFMFMELPLNFDATACS